MKLTAIVPAKSPTRAKSRLKEALEDNARAAFASRLLEHVVSVLRASEIEDILIATDGDDVEAWAVRHETRVRRDSGKSGLNEVIDACLVDAHGHGADGAIVFMADLPKLEATHVSMIRDALQRYEVVLVRDHLGRHTNVLGVRPPTAMKTCFGSAESYREHLERAHSLGLSVIGVEDADMAFDVDRPEDLEKWMRMAPR